MQKKCLLKRNNGGIIHQLYYTRQLTCRRVAREGLLKNDVAGGKKQEGYTWV